MKAFVHIILGLAVAGCVTVTAAASSTLPDLPQSYIFSQAGKLTGLRPGVAYRAHLFPVPVRVTVPDRSWSGAQWKANTFHPDQIERRHLTCGSNPLVCAPPYYGWVALGQTGSPGNHAPRDLILIMTGYTRTPSVAATVTSLRTRGHGATYGPAAPVKLGGFPGVQFDGIVTAPLHVFVPFSPRTHKATGFADAVYMDGPGHGFRFVVLDVRGRTVIVMVASTVMTADAFTAFLPTSDAVLRSLRFPATTNGG